MQWGKSRNPSTRKHHVTNLPARTLSRLKSVCFVVVQMHWKGSCGQLQVRNVNGKEGHVAVKCQSKSEDAKVHMVEQEVFYFHRVSGKDQLLCCSF